MSVKSRQPPTQQQMKSSFCENESHVDSVPVDAGFISKSKTVAMHRNRVHKALSVRNVLLYTFLILLISPDVDLFGAIREFSPSKINLAVQAEVNENGAASLLILSNLFRVLRNPDAHLETIKRRNFEQEQLFKNPQLKHGAFTPATDLMTSSLVMREGFKPSLFDNNGGWLPGVQAGAMCACCPCCTTTTTAASKVGLIIGIVAVVAVLGILAYVLTSKPNKQKKEKEKKDETNKYYAIGGIALLCGAYYCCSGGDDSEESGW